jgi:hypothetical protein
MRQANSLDRSASKPTPGNEDISETAGDALASACLFAIVGGLVFALAIVPAVSVILVGAVLGAVAGIAIAYQ